jgi:hypothetical protein
MRSTPEAMPLGADSCSDSQLGIPVLCETLGLLSPKKFTKNQILYLAAKALISLIIAGASFGICVEMLPNHQTQEMRAGVNNGKVDSGPSHTA